VGAVTFVPNFQIFLSTRSLYEIGYCNYVNTASAPPPSKRQLQRALRTATRLGCSQITLTSGELIDELPEIGSVCRYYGYRSWFDYIYHACDVILQYNQRHVLFPRLDVGPVPYAELRRLRKVLPLANFMLQAADDTLLDKLPHRNAPHMKFAYRLAALEDYGRVEIPVTTGIKIGIEESEESWGEAARAVSRLNQKYGHIQSFLLQPFYPLPYCSMSRQPPVSDETVLSAIQKVRANLDKNIVLSVDLQYRPHLLCDAIRAGATDLGDFQFGTSERINFDSPAEMELLKQQADSAKIKICERMPFFGNSIQWANFPRNVREKVQRTRKISDKIYVADDSAAACM
jgi:7,8-didemethyl-8-hydroxy-5-deazariboflavin synthase CofG subunit